MILEIRSAEVEKCYCPTVLTQRRNNRVSVLDVGEEGILTCSRFAHATNPHSDSSGKRSGL